MNSRQKSLIAVIAEQHLEIEHLRNQRDLLQAENTDLVLENRELKNMFNGSIKKYEPEEND